jgi:RNA polymerase sigma-70 factor, ECF subfamily
VIICYYEIFNIIFVLINLKNQFAYNIKILFLESIAQNLKGIIMANMEQTPDAILLHNYISGDENALQILIDRHQSKIYGFIYSKIPDRSVCDDIFQDTFIKVIKTLRTKGYSEEGKFLPWVMRIASNLVIDYFRHNKKMPFQRETEEYSIFNFMTDSALTIENHLIEKQVELDVRKIVEQLPDDQREVIKMRYYDDLSFKEISEITGVSINTALGRMRYAVINLRKIIEKHNIILTN